MSDRTRRCALVSMVGLGGCVLQEPIGNASLESSTSGDSTSGDSTGQSTFPPEETTDTSGETTGGNEACSVEPEEHFTWQWNFGAYEPTPDDLTYDLDALALIDCEPSGYIENDDALELELGCSVDGMPIEPQTLTVSPIPMRVLESLQQDEPLSVAFRPAFLCPNGCNPSDRDGWLAVRRREDETLLLGVVDVPRLLQPVDELAPIAFSLGASPCAPVFDEGFDCEEPGWSVPMELTLSEGVNWAAIVGSGTAVFGPYDVLLNIALDGEFSFVCDADGGERSHVDVMILRR